MTMTTGRAPRTRGLWLIPAGLILLTMIPIVSGSLRLTQLGGGPELIPESARFTSFPLPVILHIVSATTFSVVGAFQFLPALRRGRRSWHKLAGRILIPAGLVVALSGLWMASFSDLPAGDGPFLHVIRLVFGTYMVVSIVLSVRALTQRKYSLHGAWMTRAYALGVAAGTQAIFLIPGSIIFGSAHELSRAIAMGAAWVVNLGVAELVIWRRTRRASRLGRHLGDLPGGQSGDDLGESYVDEMGGAPVGIERGRGNIALEDHDDVGVREVASDLVLKVSFLQSRETLELQQRTPKVVNRIRRKLPARNH